MKNETELNHDLNPARERPASMLRLHEIDTSLAEMPDHDHNRLPRIDEMKKFEPVIEHFCFEQHTPLKDLVDSFERAVLIKVLSRFNGNQKQSAKYLGMKCSTLNEKIKKHNIQFKKKAY